MQAESLIRGVEEGAGDSRAGVEEELREVRRRQDDVAGDHCRHQDYHGGDVVGDDGRHQDNHGQDLANDVSNHLYSICF